jgi:hypothetical protein
MEEWLRLSYTLSESKNNFWESPRQIYYVKKDDGSYIVGGYYRVDPDHQFTFLTIPTT